MRSDDQAFSLVLALLILVLAAAVAALAIPAALARDDRSTAATALASPPAPGDVDTTPLPATAPPLSTPPPNTPPPTAAVAEPTPSPEPTPAPPPTPAPVPTVDRRSAFDEIISGMLAGSPIRFEANSTTVAPESHLTLDRVAAMLSGTDFTARVEGHTDDSGNPLLNQDLSEGRARAVVNYLVVAGVDEDLLTPVGMGARQPIADNDTVAGRATNRRIDIELD